MNAEAKQVARVETQAVALTPMDMIERALERNVTPEVIAKLMDLQERWQANAARAAFDAAISEAKSEIPVIAKNRSVSFGQGRAAYKHEDMAEIARTVDPILSKHGLSYRFRTSTEGNMVAVTCIVSHRDGHSQENSLSAGADTSGSKNSIQAVGSTVTYLQRYTLKAALGLAASADDDGKAVDNSPINEKQLAELIALADDVGADKAKFCKYMKVEGFAEIPAAQFDNAKAALEAKRPKK